MAIVIDGSANTIAGLAVGGLPDGSVDTDTLAANAVTTAKIGANAVTTAKTSNVEVDQWRVSADFTMSTSGAFVTSDWERVDSDNSSKLGTGMTESSGVFSFPSTGIWRIDLFYTTLNTAGDSKYNDARITVTTNNSSYGEACSVYICNDTQNFLSNGSGSFIFDVTDTSTHKVKIYNYAWSGNTVWKGDSTTNYNALTFTRLGDT